MGRIWTQEARFRQMLEVELLACEALCKLGQVPPAAVRRIRRRARLNLARVDRREKETRHDVVAFLGELASHIGSDARYLHLGLTSSDVLDTATAVQLAEATDLLLEDLEKLRSVVRRLARKHRDTVCIGRTHGVHAEPTTFGLKLAVFYSELHRAIGMLRLAREAVAIGKISGAVGTYAHLSPSVEKYICAKLKIRPAPISTQVVPRDGYAATSLENIALWHERDISHSSVERVILPDATITLDYMILELTRILQGLTVYPAHMRRNLELTRGLIFSESVLLALCTKGLVRPAAYKIVQRSALAAWAGKGDFFTRLSKDPQVRRRLSAAELKACFDLRRHLKHVGTIFKRVGL